MAYGSVKDTEIQKIENYLKGHFTQLTLLIGGDDRLLLSHR